MCVDSSTVEDGGLLGLEIVVAFSVGDPSGT